jgi:hypothetical protein
MFVASVISVVLAGAALLAVVSLGDGGTTDPPNPDVDSCVVGSWRELSSTQQLPTGIGELVLTGEGPVFEFGEDGTGAVDFGTDHDTGTVYRSESLGETVDAKVWGTVRFRFVARDGTFQFSDLDSAARFRMDALGVPVEDRYDLSSDPVGYRCRGDSLEQFNDGFEATYQRVG